MSIECPKCRTSNVDAARFCQACGKRLSRSRYSGHWILLGGCLAAALAIFILKQRWEFETRGGRYANVFKILGMPQFAMVFVVVILSQLARPLYQGIGCSGQVGVVLVFFTAPVLLHHGVAIAARQLGGAIADLVEPGGLPLLDMIIVATLVLLFWASVYFKALFSAEPQPTPPSARILGTEDEAEAASRKLADKSKTLS